MYLEFQLKRKGPVLCILKLKTLQNSTSEVIEEE